MTRDQKIKHILKLLRSRFDAKEDLQFHIDGALDFFDSFARGLAFGHEVGKADTKRTLRNILHGFRVLPASVQSQPALQAAVARIEQLLQYPPANHRGSGKERAAVQAAKILIVSTTDGDLTTTRGGLWDRLALAILDDRNKKTLTRHLTLRPSAKKPQGRKPKTPRN